MEKVESFLRIISCKDHFYENSSDYYSGQNNNYGFKSNVTPPPNDHLI